MSDVLIFAMGEFDAEFPCDRMYAKNHMWAKVLESGCFRFVFEAYAVRLLQVVYFIDFDCAIGAKLEHRQEFGNIESKKAESGMYAPMRGELSAINDELLDDPSLINVDKYEQGWLIEMREAQGALLTTAEYLEHLIGAWEIAQRTIKGQANTEDS